MLAGRQHVVEQPGDAGLVGEVALAPAGDDDAVLLGVDQDAVEAEGAVSHVDRVEDHEEATRHPGPVAAVEARRVGGPDLAQRAEPVAQPVRGPPAPRDLAPVDDGGPEAPQVPVGEVLLRPGEGPRAVLRCPADRDEQPRLVGGVGREERGPTHAPPERVGRPPSDDMRVLTPSARHRLPVRVELPETGRRQLRPRRVHAVGERDVGVGQRDELPVAPLRPPRGVRVARVAVEQVGGPGRRQDRPDRCFCLVHNFYSI